MQSFKEFIRVKDRESKMFIRESIYELKHNAFYNTDYFNKKYLYEEDAPEETDAETLKIIPINKLQIRNKIIQKLSKSS